MSFLLLAKEPDGRLSLLSAQPAPSRREALDELTQLTHQPEFDWDAEVYVVNLDQVTPVLLVRPLAPTAPDVSSEEDVAEDGPEDDTEEISEPVTEDPRLPERSEELAPEPVILEMAEPVSIEPLEVAPMLAEAAMEALSTDAVQTAVITEIDPAIVEAVESAVMSDIDPAWAEAVVESGEPCGSQAEAITLKEALSRTTAHMESTGVSVPMSIATSEEPADDLSEAIAAAVADMESVPSIETTASIVEGISGAAWPWASLGETESTFSLEALEEPGSDTESLVRASGDDETMSVAGPVILGSYKEAEDSAPEASGESDAEDSVETTQGDDGDEGATIVELPSAESRKREPMGSDLILDLEEVVSETSSSASEEPEGYHASGTETEGLTCEECVYVETCPNKEQREPVSCGSFQWR